MIYFDNAATTLPKPECVVQAVTDALRTAGNPGRGVHDASLCAARIVYDARAAMAELFHAESADTIAFTANATQALNTAVKGVLQRGDHVISTDLEHNSVLRPLYEMEDLGVSLTFAPADSMGRIWYEDIEAAVRPETKAIICTHASNVTGNLLDVARIGAIARRHHLLLIVDAAQTAGVFSIDVQAMGIDILCFTGHKGLLGPQGTGGLYVRPGLAIRPLLSGGSGVQSYLRHHPPQMPAALEAGTLNAHGLAGLRAAAEYLRRTGVDAIRQKGSTLMRRFYDQARQIPGITIYGDFSQPERCPIVSLNVRNYDSGEVSDALFTKYGIATRPGAHCAPRMHAALGTTRQGTVRFSFSHFNTIHEIDDAVSALRDLAKEEET